MALAGWMSAGSLTAQVVKAPRYQGGLDAPAPALNLPPLPPAITPRGTVVESVVARVNDQIITRSDIERNETQLEQEAQQSKMSPADYTVAQHDLLRDMIDEQLLISKAKEMGLNADADVIRRLDEIRKQNKLDSLDDLEKAARSQGVNFEDFKAQIRNQILKQEVVRDEVGRKLQLSESDENKYYAAHLKEFEQPEQIHLSEILIPLPETATQDQIAQAEAKANDVKSKVMQGGDFADLAKKYSGGPTAAQGGELGAYKKGALPQVLEDQTYPLKVGESSQPIRTRQGYVILKVTGHDLAGPAPLKDVEPQIQEALYTQAIQPALRAYLTKLREESYVNLAPGYVDSGASPNETATVFTAYAPPPVKKKVKAKSRFDNNNGRYRTVAAAKGPSPDTGGRTITGPDAPPAGGVAPAAAIDPATGLAVVAPPSAVSSAAAAKGTKLAKVKKQKREKIRFGQAPTKSLGGGASDDTETAAAPVTPAPGAAIATSGGGIGATTTVPATSVAAGADLADNPLNAAEAPKKKTRFAQTETAVKQKKVATLTAKEREKIIATPTPASAQEKADAREQAAPLGLAGDTAKHKKVKVKKPKHKKGEPRPEKQRLAEKAPEPKPVAPEIAPTASKKLAPIDVPDKPAAGTQPATPPNSATPKPVPSQSDTTLPPATQPPAGSPQQGQPVPGTNPPN